MSTPLKKIAENVRRYRKEKGWTQAELAQSAGCVQSAISGIETRGFQPGFDLLAQIATALGVTSWQLLGVSVTHGKLHHLPSEVQRLLRLSESTDPHLARLAQDLTQLVGKHIDLAQKKGRRRRSPRA